MWFHAGDVVAVPLYVVYMSAAFVAGIVLAVGHAMYRLRTRSIDDLECEQQARHLLPVHLPKDLLAPTPSIPSLHSVASFRTRLANSVHWKSGSQQLIDTLRPEYVHENRGKLNFSLGYDRDANTLYVHLLEAIDLPIRDMTGSSDPYTRVFLLEQPQECKRTKVHRRNLNPKFQQTLSFPGHSIEKLNDMTLVMQVLDFDRFSSDDPIGEVLLPLRGVKYEHAPVYWKHLQRPSVSKEHCGEVMLSLCYLPDLQRMAVTVVKCRQLSSKDRFAGTSDPYVKLWLVQHGCKLEKKKTTVKQQTLAPLFNESFAFQVPEREVLARDLNLVVTVMDYDMISSNDEIGHTVIGPLGSSTGIKQWKDAIDQPETPIVMWQKLSPRW